MKTSSLHSFIVLLLLICTIPVLAQQSESDATRRNTLKYHVGSLALFPKSFVMSYERLTKPNQSFSVMAGYVQFPKLNKKGAIIEVKDNVSKNGLTIGGDYRFYLQKENKYPAPHGVFIGPYANMYHFANNRNLNITSSDGTSKTQASLISDLNIINIGFEMGYQFVFNDRWSLEFIFIAPSVSRYWLDLKLDGNYDVNEEDIIKDELLSALIDNFPLIKDLLTDKEIKLQGRTNTWAPGFRYQLNVGYRFGK